MATTETRTPRSNRRLVLALVAVLAVAVVVVVVMSLSDDPEAAAGPPLELSLGEDPSMAMCLAFDVAELAKLPVAFEGTATEVDGDQVTLDVDRWFEGGDAERVRLTAPGGMVALIGGIDFVEGEQYLITATDGTVNYCGFSGPATPELRAAFEEAFAA